MSGEAHALDEYFNDGPSAASLFLSLRGHAVSTRRSLALREFALVIEVLERFVRQRTASPHPRVRLRCPSTRKRALRSSPVAYLSALSAEAVGR
jgi:hypothetical protein